MKSKRRSIVSGTMIQCIVLLLHLLVNALGKNGTFSRKERKGCDDDLVLLFVLPDAMLFIQSESC